MKRSAMFAVAMIGLSLNSIANAQAVTSVRSGGTRGGSITFDDSRIRTGSTQRHGVVNPYSGQSSYLYYNSRGDATHYSYQGGNGRATTQQRLNNTNQRRNRTR